MNFVRAPIAGASPETTFKTPSGTPACLASSANASVEKGVNSEGFRTIVHPAASAGAIFQRAIASGKFQGVMAPTTPIGCNIVMFLEFSLGGNTLPFALQNANSCDYVM